MNGPEPIAARRRLLSAVAAYALLAYAVDRLPPSSKVVTVLLVVLTLGLALGGARAGPMRSGRWTAPLPFIGLLGTVLWELWLLPGRSLDLSLEALRAHFLDAGRWASAGLRDWAFSAEARLMIVLALGVVALSYAWRGMPGGRWRFPMALVLYGYLGAWALVGRPRPVIDVLLLEENACATLLRGEDPYVAATPNPYPSALYLPLEILRDGHILGFPYPPLTVLALVPGHLAGDVRWSLLAAVLGAVAFLVATGRRLGLPPGHPAELAALAFLLHPRGLMVVQRGWTEPLLALAAGAAAWAVVAHQPRSTGAALAALVTFKQTGVLGAAGFAWVARLRWRDVALGALAAGTLLLASVVWNPAAAWRGLITWHARSPFRVDSLSIPTVLVPPATLYLSPWEQAGLGLAGLAAAAGVLFLALRGPGASVSRSALATAAGLLAFFLLNKAAHVNYYWWAASFLALAAVSAAGEQSHGTSVAKRGAAALETPGEHSSG